MDEIKELLGERPSRVEFQITNQRLDSLRAKRVGFVETYAKIGAVVTGIIAGIVGAVWYAVTKALK